MTNKNTYTLLWTVILSVLCDICANYNMSCFYNVMLWSNRSFAVFEVVTKCFLVWFWPWFNPHPSGCIGLYFDVILICQELSSQMNTRFLCPPFCSWCSLVPWNLQVYCLLWCVGSSAKTYFSEYIFQALLTYSCRDLFICYSVLPKDT